MGIKREVYTEIVEDSFKQRIKHSKCQGEWKNHVSCWVMANKAQGRE